MNASDAVRSGIARRVALLARAGLRGEDAQRLAPRSCGFNEDTVFGVCRDPKPHGVQNMQWAALKCGVSGRDWGSHLRENVLSEVHSRARDYSLPGISREGAQSVASLG